MALVDANLAQWEGKGWRCPVCRRATRARDGLLSLPNNPLIVAAVQALCAGGPHARASESGWRKDKSGAPYYDFWSGSGGRIKVWTASDDNGAAWSDVASYSALSIDVAITLLSALACDSLRASTCAPRRDAVWLGGSAVMYAKHYKRYGAERLEFAQSVDVEIERLLRLRFDVLSYPGFDPVSRTWKRDGITRFGVSLFDLDEDQPPVANDTCAGAMPLRLGAWADHWLNASGPMWVGSLPDALLKLDHRSSRGADVLAKKLGLLLTLSWGASRNKKHQDFEIRSLLRRLGELRSPGGIDAHYGGRLADRFEEAMLRLSEAGLFQHHLHAVDAQARRAEGRQWFEEWLGAKLTVQRPSFLTRVEQI
ncbi:hypothetical protein [Terricaulis silvestris]|uniref:Uncharacterized protein n=1 Tax=Terricaulis silvestris TaxID=2686094 RepID=A0A6I6MM95_9CAUL|nr:hypothetical protein [Terricaulis silvestris]QGZ96595.1 hypothetical protein DSM104635_03455 [Terricaulis silvestris]